MFGDRPDGRRIRKVDPIQLITGFLMKKEESIMVRQPIRNVNGHGI